MARSAHLAAVTVACSCLLALPGCPPPTAAPPPNLRILMQEPLSLDLDGDLVLNHRCLVGDDGSLWFFGYCIRHGTNPLKRLVAARHDGKQWSPITDIATRCPADSFVLGMLAPAWLDRDTPVLLFTFLPSSPRVAVIQMTRWDGSAWSAPIGTPGEAENSGAHALVAWAGPAPGCLRCVYVGKLTPPEDYSIGGMDGYFPCKTFYMEFADGKWGKPAAMVPASRWNYLGLHLVAGKTVTCLLGLVRYANWLFYESSLLELRYLKDGQWSKPERIGSPRGDIRDPCGVFDARGTLHVVYEAWRSNKYLLVHRTKTDGRWSQEEPLGEGTGCIGADRDGNVYLYCVVRPSQQRRPWASQADAGQARLKVLVRGEAPLPDVAVEELFFPLMYTAPDGGVFLVGEAGSGGMKFIKVSVSPP